MLSFIKKNKLYFEVLLLWLCIAGGVFLRSYKADFFPIDNNDDGLFYVWTGNSFFENQFSLTSHTIFDSKNTALLWRSQYHDYIPHLRFGMKIVQPWFDHPPLGSILISIPAHLLGYDQIEQIPQLIVRLPALIASIFTLLLTFILARQLFGKKVAIFALLFLATTPYFVFAHRQSYLENMLTPIFLGSVVSFISYTQTKNKKYAVLSAVLAFCCGWIKIPAFSVPMMLMAWSLYKKDWWAIKLFLLTAVLSPLSYVAYGLISNAHFFIATLGNQGERGMFLSSFLYSFTNPMFYGEFMDGLYILGLVACFVLIAKKDKSESETLFTWLFVAWLLVLFLTSGEFNNSPWYKYPLIPFMSIGLGVFAQQVWEKQSIFIFSLFLLFGFSSYDLAGIEIPSQLLRIGTIALTIPFALLFVFPKQQKLQFLSKWTVLAVFILIFVGNILAVERYPVQRCLKENCLLPEKIILEQN